MCEKMYCRFSPLDHTQRNLHAHRVVYQTAEIPIEHVHYERVHLGNVVSNTVEGLVLAPQDVLKL